VCVCVCVHVYDGDIVCEFLFASCAVRVSTCRLLAVYQCVCVLVGVYVCVCVYAREAEIVGEFLYASCLVWGGYD